MRVRTPSRLHLGFIDLERSLGRLYGSVGVAIDKPNVVLDAEPAAGIEATGPDSEVACEAIKRVADFYRIKRGIRVNVIESIPRHSGLGSGTQLMLAAASAYARLNGIKAGIRELSTVLGRGTVSGIGTAAFQGGGFIIDSGIDPRKPAPPAPLLQHPFPEDWVFVVAVPEKGGGFYGEREDEAFRKPAARPMKEAEALIRLAFKEMVPSLLDRDIEAFGEAVTELDRKTGRYFSSAQGGIHKGSGTRKVVDDLLACGAYGAGQSSWGPACYGLTEKKKAPALEKRMQKLAEGEVFTAKANNRGAKTDPRS